jgi:asparagine synthase (glutamine-hydrolysing)
LNTQDIALIPENRGEPKKIKINLYISILLIKYVLQKLMERPKMGFDAPIESWLLGLLQDLAKSLPSESRLRHLSEQCNLAYSLWDILMFQVWLAEQ